MPGDAVLSVSSDANFPMNRLPDYKIGADNIIIEPEDIPEVPSLKDVIANESAQLIEQHQRLSVRELAKKFENGLSITSKLSDEEKSREVASLDRHVLLKKLRDILDSLRGRVAGRNRDDAEEAISMVEALAVHLTQREGELFQEKLEIKKMSTMLEHASVDAKKVVEEERAIALVEIENARAAVLRVEEAFHAYVQAARNEEKHDIEELMREVQEARRIKMLHQPSRVMDMEHELRALRIQLAEKAMHASQLQKELVLAINKRSEVNKSHLYEFEGLECLGSCLCILAQSDAAPDIRSCSIQWYRISREGNKKELIYGATKPIYAPEPFDVGRVLQAEISVNGGIVTVATCSPIEPAAGLGSYVEALLLRPHTDFKVVIIQTNGFDHPSRVRVFRVGRLKLKLYQGKMKTKESYSASMMLCGVRGGGNAAANALFWQLRKGLSVTLAFESARERNAAIMLARRFAFDCNIRLVGPDDMPCVGAPD